MALVDADSDATYRAKLRGREVFGEPLQALDAVEVEVIASIENEPSLLVNLTADENEIHDPRDRCSRDVGFAEAGVMQSVVFRVQRIFVRFEGPDDSCGLVILDSWADAGLCLLADTKCGSAIWILSP